jgi:hypothetical protein
MARKTRKNVSTPKATPAAKPAARPSGKNGGPRSSAASVTDSTVRTRTATPAEREPGASIEVGKATTPAVTPEPTPDAPSAPLSGDEALAAITGTDPAATDGSTPETPAEDTPAADAPKPGTKAARYAEAAAAAEAAKPPKKTAAKKPGIKATKYPAWLPAAVKRSRHISGMKPGSGGDDTLAYPGPKQHLNIRSCVTEMLTAEGKDVTPENIMALAGVKSLPALVKIASWESDKASLAPMRPLSNACGSASGVNGKTDGWAIGRYLASALVAWVEEIRAEAKAAKAAEKSGEKAAA